MTELIQYAQIAQSISITFALLFAFYGFDAWRREHIGKRKIELAEDVLALFYQARDAIESIRSPFGFSGEGESRKSNPQESEDEKKALDQAYVLIERYKNHAELFAKIHALRYRFMAQIGCNSAKPFDDLNQILNTLINSAHKMARLTTLPNSSYRETHTQQLLEVHSIYYSTEGESDPISPRVSIVIKEIEASCRSIIESKYTLYAVINLRLSTIFTWRPSFLKRHIKNKTQ